LISGEEVGVKLITQEQGYEEDSE
jgi:ribosomal protein S10